ncbi:GNAT family N-acetyltransferase [Flavobacterium rakeshii]|uniref:GNAT family N-acetyltransferase n=2 Tax=Flavobacterium rakeshii TaxID=1038845 RepID=A0A6N8HEV9_9FLAO|nr:GNAT family N-acetyltransferase [Flavobacterium rakeshii]MEE1898825.1 GNAT family N-acetyltransferase [Flavobacterium rakeshii]MUV04167.1 GNAT family N-acetyltransferase [Flavobacterium rakeshii]
MIKIQKYHPNESMNNELQKEVVNFLYKSLEQYGDPEDDINKAVNYALNKNNEKDKTTGGLVLTARLEENNAVVGAVVINETGMGGYIPENILVYIATDPNQRGKGIGKKLMQEALESSKGDVALHVEPDNPAKRLYENLGFTNKYLEMRYKKTI